MGGGKTRRALLAGLGGIGLAGVAEYIANPTRESEVESGGSRDTGTPEGPGTTSPLAERGTVTQTADVTCRESFEAGFEGPLDGQFERLHGDITRTTEYAHTGDRSVLLQADEETMNSLLMTSFTICGELSVEVSARHGIKSGGVFSLGVRIPGTTAGLKIGPFGYDNECQLQEDTTTGSGDFLDIPATVGTDWTEFALFISAGSVTASVGSTSVSYEPELDWTSQPVVVQLDAGTSFNGPEVAAAFDDLRIHTG